MSVEQSKLLISTFENDMKLFMEQQQKKYQNSLSKLIQDQPINDIVEDFDKYFEKQCSKDNSFQDKIIYVKNGDLFKAGILPSHLTNIKVYDFHKKEVKCYDVKDITIKTSYYRDFSNQPQQFCLPLDNINKSFNIIIYRDSFGNILLVPQNTGYPIVKKSLQNSSTYDNAKHIDITNAIYIQFRNIPILKYIYNNLKETSINANSTQNYHISGINYNIFSSDISDQHLMCIVDRFGGQLDCYKRNDLLINYLTERIKIESNKNTDLSLPNINSEDDFNKKYNQLLIDFNQGRATLKALESEKLNIEKRELSLSQVNADLITETIKLKTENESNLIVNNKLEEIILTQTTEISNVKNELITTNIKLIKTQKENTEIQSQNIEIKNKNAENEEIILKLKQTNISLTEEKSKLLDHIIKKDSLIKQLNENNKQTSLELEKVNKNYVELQQTNNKLTDEITSLTHKNEEFFKMINEESKKHLEKLDNSISNSINDIMMTEISQLKEQLETLKNELKKEKESKKDIETKFKNIKTLLANLS